MNVKQLIAVGALAIGFSSCGLFGNAVQGGPLFSGNVGGTPPSPATYQMAVARFTDFGAPDTNFQAAAFATAIQINNGVGAYSGSLVPTIDLNGDARRFYKVVVYDDKNGDNKYDTTASGTKDVVLADSTNGKAVGGKRFFLYSNADDVWTTGGADKAIKKGWNLVTDPKNDTVGTGIDLGGRADDVVTQAGGFGGLDISY